MTMFNLLRPYTSDTMMNSFEKLDDYYNFSMHSLREYQNKTEDGIDFIVELPGASRSDIDVSVKGNVLTIIAEREQFNYNSKSKVKYKNSWTLPQNAILDSVSAKYDAGLLKIEIPLKKEYSKKIEVE